MLINRGYDSPRPAPQNPWDNAINGRLCTAGTISAEIPCRAIPNAVAPLRPNLSAIWLLSRVRTVKATCITFVNIARSAPPAPNPAAYTREKPLAVAHWVQLPNMAAIDATRSRGTVTTCINSRVVFFRRTAGGFSVIPIAGTNAINPSAAAPQNGAVQPHSWAANPPAKEATTWDKPLTKVAYPIVRVILFGA